MTSRELRIMKNTPGAQMPNSPIRVVAKLNIEILSNGQTRVNGPLNNRALCEAMCEEGLKVVREFHRPRTDEEAQAQNSVIITEEKRIIIP